MGGSGVQQGMTPGHLIIPDGTDAIEDYEGLIKRARSNVRLPVAKDETICIPIRKITAVD